ncbi:helix-turn-helix domain-containing protein [Micromonospora sp. NPDC001898]|uniref:helix-turn-helix domain-containing protein n=1 Tax=Micromonospora sp. NPDC001898 TaxID=3364221 RepID=UPI0036B36EEA
MSTSPPRDPKIPDLVSLQEAADILGISKQAVHKRVEASQLVGARVGTAWVFRRSVVEAARPAPAPE